MADIMADGKTAKVAPKKVAPKTGAVRAKKAPLISKIKCVYGIPVHMKAADLKSTLTVELRAKIRRRVKAAREALPASLDQIFFSEHPAPRIYGLTDKACWYRIHGREFVRINISKGQIRIA